MSLAVSCGATERNAVSLYVENDTHYLGGPGSDNAYSSGIKLAYTYADNHVPGWAQPVMTGYDVLKKKLNGAVTNFSVAVAQQIYTPNNTGTSELILDDRPYAAWLYAGLSAGFKKEEQIHSVEVDLGIIGPDAGGKHTQNDFHRFIGTSALQGWDNQLNNEPTLQISYQQRRKFFRFKDDLEFIPYFGGGFGNVAINAYIGGLLRTGHHLPDDFGPVRASAAEGDTFIEPSRKAEHRRVLYGFAGGRIIGVGRNIFLDGNTFRESHRVQKNAFVAEGEFGLAGGLGVWDIAWRFVSRTPEISGKDVINSFASISLSYEY